MAIALNNPRAEGPAYPNHLEMVEFRQGQRIEGQGAMTINALRCLVTSGQKLGAPSEGRNSAR